MSLIAKIALTSFFTGIMLMLVSLILWLLEDCFYGGDSWVPFLAFGVLFVAVPLIGLAFYFVGHIIIEIWT